MSTLGQMLQRNRTAQALEIVAVFVVALVIVPIGWSLVSEEPLARQGVVWVANIGMLTTIWVGLRLRGQTWDHFGLSLRYAGRRALVRAVLQSIVVLIAALTAYLLPAILAIPLTTAPQSADMSGYSYLQDNLAMLMLALPAVYVVSSFGEEVVYRGFLINRMAEMGKGTKTAWGIALVISAIVFGLVHFDWGAMGIVQTAAMGLALGAAYLLVKRNLWVLVLAHAYIDTLLLVQMYLGPSVAP